jgi:hypothetical protein
MFVTFNLHISKEMHNRGVRLSLPVWQTGAVEICQVERSRDLKL